VPAESKRCWSSSCSSGAQAPQLPQVLTRAFLLQQPAGSATGTASSTAGADNRLCRYRLQASPPRRAPAPQVPPRRCRYFYRETGVGEGIGPEESAATGAERSPGGNDGRSSPDLIATHFPRHRRHPPTTRPGEGFLLSSSSFHSPPLSRLRLFALSSNPSPYPPSPLHRGVLQHRRSRRPSPPRPPNARHRDQLRRHCGRCG